MLKGFLTALLVITCGMHPPPLEAAEAFVSHELSFERRQNQFVHVSSRWPVGESPVEFYLPAWTPGSYLIRDYARHVERLQAFGPDGSALPVTKTAKNRWLVESSGASELRLEYDVWAGELSVAESWVESGFALLNGAGLFLYTESSRSLPQQVSVRLPESWAAVHVALPRLEGENRFRARDYDELVDSPIIAGNTAASDFEVDDQAYSLVLSGSNPFWDLEKSAADVARLVKAHHDFWGEVPFDRPYLFFNLFMAKYGGLEHEKLRQVADAGVARVLPCLECPAYAAAGARRVRLRA